MSLSSDGFFKSGRTIACFNDFGITPSSREVFVTRVMAGTIRVMLSVSWFAGRGPYTHVFLIALQIAVISVFVVQSNTSIQSVKQRLSSAHMSLHTEVMQFRKASTSIFLKSPFVIVLVCTACFSALCVSSMRWWSDRESGCTVTGVMKFSSVWLTARSRICPVWCVGEYVLIYVVRFKQSAKWFGLERIVEMNVKIANDDSRNNGDGCFDE